MPDGDDFNHGTFGSDDLGLFKIGIDDPPNDGRLSAVLTRYSKDAGQSRPFFPDRDEKLRLATGRLVAAADRWAVPRYRQLLDAKMSGG